MKTPLFVAALVLAALAPCFASAHDGAPRANYRLTFKIRAQNLEGSGSFVIQDGDKGSYVWGGEKPYAVETTKGVKVVDFKKFATQANASLVADPEGRVRVECQFEISGALAPVGEGAQQAWPVATFQYQSAFSAASGKTIVLVDEPDRHIEARVDRLPD